MKQFLINVLATIVAFVLIALGVEAYDVTKKKAGKMKVRKRIRKKEL